MKPGLKLRTSRSSRMTFRCAPARVVAGGLAGFREVLGGQRAGADRLVNALDLEHVQRAGGIADQQRARHLQLRQRLVTAGGDRARAGGQDLAAFEQRLDARVVLELLEGLERLESRIL